MHLQDARHVLEQDQIVTAALQLRAQKLLQQI